MGATVRKSDFIDAMEENQKDVRKMVMDSYHDIEKGKGHLFAAHLKETRPGVYREVPFGTGHTNYPEDLRKLKELGVRMFTGEFWHTAQNPDYPEICRQAACFLRCQLDEVFHD